MDNKSVGDVIVLKECFNKELQRVTIEKFIKRLEGESGRLWLDFTCEKDRKETKMRKVLT